MPAIKRPVKVSRLPHKVPFCERVVHRRAPGKAEVVDYFDADGRRVKRVERIWKGDVLEREFEHTYSGDKVTYTERIYDDKGNVVGTVNHYFFPEHELLDEVHKKRRQQSRTIEALRKGELNAVVLPDLKNWLLNNGFQHPFFSEASFVRNLARALTGVRYDFFKGFSEEHVRDFAKVVADYALDFLGALGNKKTVFHACLHEHKLLFAEELSKNFQQSYGNKAYPLVQALSGVDLSRFKSSQR